MNACMFDPHTFDVKVKVTVDMICKCKYGEFRDYPEIEAMRNEKCHLDFVVAVWDKIAAEIFNLNAKKDYYLKDIKRRGELARVPGTELANFIDGLNGFSYAGNFSFQILGEAKNKKFKESIAEFYEVKHKLRILEQYHESIGEVIATKPIMPYSQE